MAQANDDRLKVESKPVTLAVRPLGDDASRVTQEEEKNIDAAFTVLHSKSLEMMYGTKLHFESAVLYRQSATSHTGYVYMYMCITNNNL